MEWQPDRVTLWSQCDAYFVCRDSTCRWRPGTAIKAPFGTTLIATLSKVKKTRVFETSLLIKTGHCNGLGKVASRSLSLPQRLPGTARPFALLTNDLVPASPTPHPVHLPEPTSPLWPALARDAKTPRNLAPRADESQAQGRACLAHRGCNGLGSPRF